MVHATFLASQNGHEVVSMLLARRAFVNQATNGYHALYTASEEGHCEVVSMLLAKEGADVNQAMDNGATPLFIASQTAIVRWCRCCWPRRALM